MFHKCFNLQIFDNKVNKSLVPCFTYIPKNYCSLGIKETCISFPEEKWETITKVSIIHLQISFADLQVHKIYLFAFNFFKQERRTKRGCHKESFPISSWAIWLLKLQIFWTGDSFITLGFFHEFLQICLTLF